MFLNRNQQNSFSLLETILKSSTVSRTINVGGHAFEGPFPITNTWNLEDKSGIYAIFSLVSGIYYVIDVGESSQVKSRIETHDRKTSWLYQSTGTPYMAVLYTPYAQQSERMNIEQSLRQQFHPPCGKR